MSLINYNKYSILHLKKIIKIYNIKNYSKLKKNKLIELINNHKSSIIIQKKAREYFNSDLTCPITLCKCKYPFICIKNHNTFRYYSLLEFIEYLSKSKDCFRDPFSREILSEKTIEHIEYLIKYYHIKKLKNKYSWNKKLNIKHEYLMLTNCINEILNYIFNVEHLTIDCIYNIILPQFMYYFHFLIIRHKSSCYNLIRNYINCINLNKHENKSYIVNYLELVITFNNL